MDVIFGAIRVIFDLACALALTMALGALSKADEAEKEAKRAGKKADYIADKLCEVDKGPNVSD